MDAVTTINSRQDFRVLPRTFNNLVSLVFHHLPPAIHHHHHWITLSLASQPKTSVLSAFEEMGRNARVTATNPGTQRLDATSQQPQFPPTLGIAQTLASTVASDAVRRSTRTRKTTAKVEETQQPITTQKSLPTKPPSKVRYHCTNSDCKSGANSIPELYRHLKDVHNDNSKPTKDHVANQPWLEWLQGVSIMLVPSHEALTND